VIHSAAAVRAADRHAVEVLGIPGYRLMEQAGAAALGALRARWPGRTRLLVLAGPGNNGGDAYVLARLARAAGLGVALAAPLGVPSTTDAATAAREFLAAGGSVTPFAAALLQDADVVVDGLLGTGLTRAPAPPLATVIEAISDAGRPVLALDVPSGLDAETGAVAGVAVRAALTVTFVGLKPGLWLGAGPDHAGRIVLDTLGVPPSAFGAQRPVLRRIGPDLLARVMPARARTAHKGSHGHVLVVAGGEGMGGAALLAGHGALAAGAGLVTLATFPGHAAALAAARPELIVRAVDAPAALAGALAAADVVAIGPGLGQTPWACALYAAVMDSGKPLVVDADALNLLARDPARRANWCLTPHPGEAGRLAGVDAGAIQRDRLGSVRALAQRFGATVVLKGAGTLVAGAGETPFVCERGNPGMGAPGMGDVLTGVIAGLAAQQPDVARDLALAAVAGVDVHAAAGDRAALAGERGILAGDVIRELRACVNPVC
jgi:NAD(P)H-hydrate epimerase